MKEDTLNRTPSRMFGFNIKAFTIGPFLMQIIRYLFAFIIVVLFAEIIYMAVKTLLDLLSNFVEIEIESDVVPWGVYYIIGILFGYLAWRPDGGHIKIRYNHVGVLTFWGQRFSGYLDEGDYPWLFRKFGFNISTEPLQKTKKEENPGEFAGTPFIGERVIPIWNKDDKKHNIIVSNLTKNNNDINLTITITIQTYDPIKYMLSNDPIKYVANRTRGGIRAAVNKLLDIDVSTLQSAFSDLLYGKKVLVVFTIRETGVHAIHKIVRDKGGNGMYEVVEPDEESVAKGKRILLKRMEEEADEEMLEAASSDNKGVTVSELSIKENLSNAAMAVGARLVNIAIGDADLSPKMKMMAEKAAAEMLQRRSQLDSAFTYELVSESLKKAGLDPKTAVLVARLMDDPTGIQLSHITTDSDDDGKSTGMIREAGMIAQALRDKVSREFK